MEAKLALVIALPVDEVVDTERRQSLVGGDLACDLNVNMGCVDTALIFVNAVSQVISRCGNASRRSTDAFTTLHRVTIVGNDGVALCAKKVKVP